MHAGGVAALAAALGDQGFMLRELALRPRELFVPDEALGGAYTNVVGMIHELRSAMDALEARAVVALAESLIRERQAEARAHTAHESDQAPPPKKLLREAANEAAREVSMLTRKSPASASHSLASQRRLVADMPEMLTALATAQITSTVAHRTARSFAPLSPAQRTAADRYLCERLPDLDGAGSETWNGATAAAIAAADPAGQGRRHRRAMQERHVTLRRAEHGMATISARVSALDGAKIRKRLSLEAERLRAAGDRRGHQAIQADTFVDTLLGQEEAMVPTTLDIGVMITDRALLHPGTGDLAQIEGYGTAPAEVLREELRGPCGAALAQQDENAMGPDGPALGAVLRRLFTHPRTGELVAVESRARAFPAALAKFIRWRDQVCRGPHCDAPIRQIDHIRPHASGGHTCLDNGQGLCAHCNGKEQQTRSVRRVESTGADGHIVEWTSRAGTRRLTRPRALIRPQAPPRPVIPAAPSRRRPVHRRRRRPPSTRSPDTPA
ncbi:HNH endonuclease [Brachybacterium avium]|uniref:HNH endonuclease n=1 Tax=Brachybacterium avium TaxID=2017485 RepID=A0A220UGE1_9MICO|nr:HNH endonuclease [Brachybacterium avium]